MDEKVLQDILSRIEALERRITVLEGTPADDVVDFSDFQEDLPEEDIVVEDMPEIDEPQESTPQVVPPDPEPEKPQPTDLPENIPANIPDSDSGSGLLFDGYDIPAVEKSPRRRSIHEAASEKKTLSVADLLADSKPWLHDMPGSEVKAIRSAITLGDQVLFIRRLFRDDSALYSDTISRLDGMKTFSQALEYIVSSFPEWDMSSEDVYRFLMAVRRKLRNI